MSENRKQRLIELGPEALADALLELAERDGEADRLVKRMISPLPGNTQRFKTKMAGIKRLRRFIPRKESSRFAQELYSLLQDLKAEVKDPRLGVELTAAFFETDEAVFETCDDSNGSIGDVYRFEAAALFEDYARNCNDKDWIVDLVLHLNRNDGFGVRDVLIDRAAKYLPESSIRALIARFHQMAEEEEDKEFGKRHWLFGIESLARQIKDAPLFEKTRIASWGKLNSAACVDIARVYLESGDARTARSWLERIPESESFQAHERDALLLEVYGQLHDGKKRTEVAWRVFKRSRSEESLQELLAVIGPDQRERVVADEVGLMLTEEDLSLSDLTFLIELGRLSGAEDYLLQRADRIDGDLYGCLLPPAEALDAGGRPLAATLIYRALLDSILERAQSRIYSHGVRYLKKLDALAKSISDWHGLEDHAAYTARLRDNHIRKRAFWSRYEK